MIIQTVIIEVHGGVATVVEVPKNVQVLIKDYDTEGVDAMDCEVDEDGQLYILTST